MEWDAFSIWGERLKTCQNLSLFLYITGLPFIQSQTTCFLVQQFMDIHVPLQRTWESSLKSNFQFSERVVWTCVSPKSSSLWPRENEKMVKIFSMGHNFISPCFSAPGLLIRPEQKSSQDHQVRGSCAWLLGLKSTPKFYLKVVITVSYIDRQAWQTWKLAHGVLLSQIFGGSKWSQDQWNWMFIPPIVKRDQPYGARGAVGKGILWTDSGFVSHFSWEWCSLLCFSPSLNSLSITGCHASIFVR